MKFRCTLCDAGDTSLDEFNECVDKSACSRREKNPDKKSEDLNELRVISDHLGSIRDLLALISREMPDQRERLIAASLGGLLSTGMNPIVAAKVASDAANAAMVELGKFAAKR